SGTLSGSGTLGGTVEWTGGSISGTGTGLTNAGNLKVTGADQHFLTGTLKNTGTIVHSDNAIVYFTSAELLNQSGGVYDFQSGTLYPNGGTNLFTNSGTLRKSTGADPSTVAVPFNSSGGTIDVQQGTLSLTGGGTSTGGTYTVATDAILEYAGGTHTL